MGKQRRAFFALKPDDDGIDFLTNRIQLFRGRGFEQFGRFIQSDDLHVTLRFLGEVEEETLEALSEKAREIATGIEPFEYEIGRCEYFPRVARARIIAAEVDAPSPLKDLNKQLEEAAVEQGLAPEQWSFKPHITIARLKQGKKRPNLPNRPGAITQQASEFVLLESLMSGKGAEYSLLETFPLGNSTGFDPDFDEL